MSEGPLHSRNLTHGKAGRTIFVLYIIPGFLATSVYRAAYPGKQQSDFAQVAWSVVYGVVIYSAVKWMDARWFSYALQSNSTEFPKLEFIAVIMLTGVVLGGTAIGLHTLRYKVAVLHPRLAFLGPNLQTVWQEINEPSRQDWAVVFLEDGAIYLGWISKFAFDPDAEQQEFLLTRVRRVDDSLKEIYRVDGLGVYLNTRNVKRIEFVKGERP